MRQPPQSGARADDVRLRAGSEIVLTVERILPGGVGLAHARGQHDPLRKLLGYYERGTHRVCDVAECAVAATPVQERLTRLRALMSEGRLPEDAPEFEAVAGDEGVALHPPVAPGDEREQSRTIRGERYHFDADCFFQ